ncbi:MAG: hypothetical protein ACHQU1_11815, partial [Gemmatimonadales bacterium]
MHSAFDLLAQTQSDLEHQAELLEDASALDRRQFVFLSLVAAAASAFGVESARAQGAAPALGAPQQPAPPPIPLGNGEPPSMVFQVWPGGTGALMEKLGKERGRAAFERANFTVEKWTGPVPTSDEAIAFLPAHRLSALLKERRLSSTKLTDIYLERIKR